MTLLGRRGKVATDLNVTLLAVEEETKKAANFFPVGEDFPYGRAADHLTSICLHEEICEF